MDGIVSVIVQPQIVVIDSVGFVIIIAAIIFVAIFVAIAVLIIGVERIAYFDRVGTVGGNIADIFVITVISCVAGARSGGVIAVVLIVMFVTATMVGDVFLKGKRDLMLATGIVLLSKMR